MSEDECSLDVDVELDEHNSTCSSILTSSSSNSSRSRSSISSSTASVLSLASLSSNSSSRCSFSSSSSSGVSSGSSSSYSHTETPEKDRKNLQKRQLPATPVTPSSLVKKYPISVEENIQSYFSISSDDELPSPVKSEPLKVETNKIIDVSTISGKRPPQPLPRRALNFTPTRSSSTQSSKSEVFEPEEIDQKEFNKNFSKSWSASSCFSPVGWIKARGPTAQTWQNRSRSERIRSATISTPIEHMANLSIHCRSRSIDHSRVSTSTLTSQPSTPTSTSPNTFKTVFTFSPLKCMSRAQSTSSINSSTNLHKSSINHSVVAPLLSSKLRPLSLAPNSSIAFPARPASLLSSQSQSTTTLRASTSTLSLTTPSPNGNSSFALSLSKCKCPSTNENLNLQHSIKQSHRIVSSNNATNNTTKTPLKAQLIDDIQIQTIKLKLVETKKTDVPIKVDESDASKNSSECATKSVTDSAADDTPHHDCKQHLVSVKTHEDGKHCQCCCRYDDCFYI